MTMDNTKPPPKGYVWHKCSVPGCPYLFRGYHGKIGCKCIKCDDQTPKERVPKPRRKYYKMSKNK